MQKQAPLVQKAFPQGTIHSEPAYPTSSQISKNLSLGNAGYNLRPRGQQQQPQQQTIVNPVLDERPKFNGALSNMGLKQPKEDFYQREEPANKFETVCRNALRFLRDPYHPVTTQVIDGATNTDKMELATQRSGYPLTITPQSSHHTSTTYLNGSTIETFAPSQQPYTAHMLPKQQQQQQSYPRTYSQLQYARSRDAMSDTPSNYYPSTENYDEQYYRRQEEPTKRIKPNPQPQDEKNAIEQMKQALQMQMMELRKQGYGFKREPEETPGFYNFCFFKSK